MNIIVGPLRFPLRSKSKISSRHYRTSRIAEKKRTNLKI